MRRINLRAGEKKWPWRPGDEPKVLTTADIFEVAMAAGESGYKLPDLRRAIAVTAACAAIKPGDTHIVLEDDQHAFIKKRLEETDWRLIDPVIAAVADDVENAESFTAADLQRAAE